jgi:hypothetical protein
MAYNEPTALGRLKVHPYAVILTLKIHLSAISYYGYCLAIGCYMPVKGGRVSSLSFPRELRDWDL